MPNLWESQGVKVFQPKLVIFSLSGEPSYGSILWADDKGIQIFRYLSFLIISCTPFLGCGGGESQSQALKKLSGGSGGQPITDPISGSFLDIL